VFALGQPLSFAVDLRQKFPEERRLQQQSKKFLTYDVRDGTGATVRGTNGVTLKVDIADILKDTYALETNGAYRKVVPEGKDGTPLGDFVLDEATIKAHSASGPKSTAIVQDIWGASVTQKFVKNIRVDDTLGAPIQAAQPMWFSIYFPTYGADVQGEESFTVHRITAPGDQKNMPPKGAQGWLQYRSAALPANLDKQSVQRPQNNVRVTLPPPTATQPGMLVSIDFDHVPRLGNVQAMEILVKYQPAQAAAGPQQPTCDPKTPVTWKAVFTIYDADRHGNPTEQISVDPESGEQQIKDVSFQVQCALPTALVTPTGPPVVTGDDSVWLQSLVSFLQQQSSTADLWASSLAPISPADAGNNAKVVALTTTLRDNSHAVKSGATATLNELNRQVNLLTAANKPLLANVPPGIGGIIASAGRAEDAFTQAVSTNQFNINAINAQVNETKTAIAEAKKAYAAAIAAIQQKLTAGTATPKVDMFEKLVIEHCLNADCTSTRPAGAGQTWEGNPAYLVEVGKQDVFKVYMNPNTPPAIIQIIPEVDGQPFTTFEAPKSDPITTFYYSFDKQYEGKQIKTRIVPVHPQTRVPIGDAYVGWIVVVPEGSSP
jgi:hypothetical protein